MRAQELKNAILQLAIRGEMTKQNINEEPASVLLEKIEAKREELIREEKIRKEKYSKIYKDESNNSYYEKLENGKINDITDEIPFEIPKNWSWTRLGNITTVLSGFAFKSSEIKEETGIRVIRISDFNENGFKDNKIVRTKENSIYDDFVLNTNSILLAMTGGTVGKTYLIKELNEKMYLNQRVASISTYSQEISIDYLNVVISSPLIKSIINKNKNSTNDNISMDTIKKFIIPIPPVNEQKQIVEKIEKLNPYIEKYDKAYAKIEKLNNEYKEELKKSILQYGIQGKLVKPNLEAESASKLIEKIQEEKRQLMKEKKIRKEPLSIIYKSKSDNQFYEKFEDDRTVDITDEIPFEIPENWSWTRLGNILTKLTDGTHKTPRYVEKGIPFISVKDMSSGTLKLDNTKFITLEEHKQLFERCNPQKGDIILSKIGTTGVPVIVETDVEFSMFVSVALLKFNHHYINRKFLKYLILSPLVQIQCKENTRGVGNKNWVMKDIANTLMPIPPIEEQEKIVNKIEEIFKKID